MFDPQTTVTLGQTVSTLKDLGFLVGTILLGWKARDLIQPAIDFFRRALRHMDAVEIGIQGMQTDIKTLMTNHLSHIEADLKHISGRRTDHVVALAETVDPQDSETTEL